MKHGNIVDTGPKYNINRSSSQIMWETRDHCWYLIGSDIFYLNETLECVRGTADTKISMFSDCHLYNLAVGASLASWNPSAVLMGRRQTDSVSWLPTLWGKNKRWPPSSSTHSPPVSFKHTHTASHTQTSLFMQSVRSPHSLLPVTGGCQTAGQEPSGRHLHGPKGAWLTYFKLGGGSLAPYLFRKRTKCM